MCRGPTGEVGKRAIMGIKVEEDLDEVMKHDVAQWSTQPLCAN